MNRGGDEGNTTRVMKTIHLALSSLLLSSFMHAGCGSDTAPADAFARDANSTGVDASVDAFSATDTPLPTPDAFMSMSTSYTTESRTIDVMGRMRSYVISVPSGSTVGLPLVIALHGDGGSGMGHAREPEPRGRHPRSAHLPRCRGRDV